MKGFFITLLILMTGTTSYAQVNENIVRKDIHYRQIESTDYFIELPEAPIFLSMPQFFQSSVATSFNHKELPKPYVYTFQSNERNFGPTIRTKGSWIGRIRVPVLGN